MTKPPKATVELRPLSGPTGPAPGPHHPMFAGQPTAHSKPSRVPVYASIPDVRREIHRWAIHPAPARGTGGAAGGGVLGGAARHWGRCIRGVDLGIQVSGAQSGEATPLISLRVPSGAKCSDDVVKGMALGATETSVGPSADLSPAPRPVFRAANPLWVSKLSAGRCRTRAAHLHARPGR